MEVSVVARANRRASLRAGPIHIFTAQQRALLKVPRGQQALSKSSDAFSSGYQVFLFPASCVAEDEFNDFL